jgi:hypothetical protein
MFSRSRVQVPEWRRLRGDSSDFRMTGFLEGCRCHNQEEIGVQDFV